eukprot:2827306-Karenia_brevis.AAC.1
MVQGPMGVLKRFAVQSTFGWAQPGRFSGGFSGRWVHQTSPSRARRGPRPRSIAPRDRGSEPHSR